MTFGGSESVLIVTYPTSSAIRSTSPWMSCKTWRSASSSRPPLDRQPGTRPRGRPLGSTTATAPHPRRRRRGEPFRGRFSRPRHAQRIVVPQQITRDGLNFAGVGTSALSRLDTDAFGKTGDRRHGSGGGRSTLDTLIGSRRVGPGFPCPQARQRSGQRCLRLQASGLGAKYLLG